MAQKVEVHLGDDLDDGPTENTIQFALDGKNYEIDLSITNAEKLREPLRPFPVARRKTTRSSGSRGPRFRASVRASDTAKIRAWTKQNRHELSDRGRIHQSGKDDYYAA